MNLILKILIFVLAIFQTNISEGKLFVSTDVISEPIFSNAFYLEKSSAELENVFSKNELGNTCKSESNLVYYRSWCISYNAAATKGVGGLLKAGNTLGKEDLQQLEEHCKNMEAELEVFFQKPLVMLLQLMLKKKLF